MKDLSYTDFFGKQVSHKKALINQVQSCIVDILADEKSISEKDFKRYDQIIKSAKEYIDYNKIEKLYNSGKRINYIAELLYDEYNPKYIMKFNEMYVNN